MIQPNEISTLYDRLYEMVHERVEEIKKGDEFNFIKPPDITKEYARLQRFLRRDPYHKRLIGAMEALNDLQIEIKIRLNQINIEELDDDTRNRRQMARVRRGKEVV